MRYSSEEYFSNTFNAGIVSTFSHSEFLVYFSDTENQMGEWAIRHTNSILMYIYKDLT